MSEEKVMGYIGALQIRMTKLETTIREEKEEMQENERRTMHGLRRLVDKAAELKLPELDPTKSFFDYLEDRLKELAALRKVIDDDGSLAEGNYEPKVYLRLAQDGVHHLNQSTDIVEQLEKYEATQKALVDALRVISLTAPTVSHLQVHDPMALKQVRDALKLVEGK